MEEVFGDGPFSITLMAAGMTLNYTNLTEITNDISDARVYGGFRTDQDAGEALGVRISQYIYTHTLWPAHGDGQ